MVGVSPSATTATTTSTTTMNKATEPLIADLAEFKSARPR